MSPSVWKKFTATFAFVLVVAHVAAEIPSYIHTCDRKDPNLQECVLNSVETLSQKLCQGIPELEVVPLQPLVVNRTKLFEFIFMDMKGIIENATINGLCNWKSNFSHLDLDTYHFDVDLTFERIILNGTIVFANEITHIFSRLPIVYTTDNTSALASIDIEIVTEDGVRYLHLSNVTLNVDIKGYQFELPAYNKKTEELREILKPTVEFSLEEFEPIKPFLEQKISQYILDSGNKIVKHFAYDELFPDQT